MNQFTFGDARPGGLEHIDLSTSHKVSKVRNKSFSFILPDSLVYSTNHTIYYVMYTRLKQ